MSTLTHEGRIHLRRARDCALRAALEARYGPQWAWHVASAEARLDAHCDALLDDPLFWREYELQILEQAGHDEIPVDPPTASDRIRAARERTS